jgi:putative transposase
MLTDGRGVPVALEVAEANRHDMKLFEPTLDNLAVACPQPTEDDPQNLCLDKGYDYPAVRELAEAWRFIAHIKARGVEAEEIKSIPGYRARRWVVERTHSWINRFRRLLIRWEKKAENYEALLHLVCGIIAFRFALIIG